MKKGLIGFILLVVLTACASSTDDSANSEKPSKASPVASAASATPEAATPTASPVPEPPKVETIKIGTAFKLKDWDVTVESAKFDQKVSDDFVSSSADDGSKFLVLRLAVKNNGTEAASFVSMFGGTSIKAVYNSKYEYTISTTLIKGDMSNTSISPLKTEKGFSAIEMPDEVVKAKEGIVVNFELDGDTKTVLIR